MFSSDPYSGEEVASSAFCAMLDIPPFLYEFSSIIFFVVPMVSLVVMYTMMGWRMVTTSRRRQSLMTGDGSHNTGRDRTKKAVLKMLGKKKMNVHTAGDEQKMIFSILVPEETFCNYRVVVIQRGRK